MILRLGYLLEVMAIIVCLHFLYGKKFKLDIATAVLVAADLLWLSLVYEKGWPHITTMPIYPMLFVYCLFHFEKKLKSDIVNLVLCVVILATLQVVSVPIWMLIFPNGLSGELEALAINATIAVLLIPLKFCKLHKLSRFLQKNEVLVKVSMFVVAIVAAICLFLYKDKAQVHWSIYIIFFACVILICVLAAGWSSIRLKAQKVETELKMHTLYEESFQNLVTDIRMKQHEFDNHINAIYSQHYVHKDYESLVKAQKEYCRSLEDNNKFNKLLSAGNPVLVGFLYGKFQEIEAKGVDVTYKVALKNMECAVPVYVVVELIGNLLNNATEEVTKAETKEQKRIDVKICEDEEKIQIEVSNPSPEYDYETIHGFFTKGNTSKGTGHGLGLYHVKCQCDEYHIEIMVNNEERENENWLSFKLLINKQ